MANNFFKKIFGGGRKEISSDAEIQQPATGDNEVKAKVIDYIAKQQAVIEGVVANIQGMVKQFGTRPEDYTLVIHIHETMLYQSCMDGNFKDSLVERLVMDCGYVFADVQVKEGMPPAELSSSKITDHVHMCLLGGRAVIGKKARLSVMEGSLVEGDVILDSTAIANMPGKRMNIGIGKSMRLQSGVVRINHIAVDDNPEGRDFDKNKYVSRAHAHITYNKNEGFILTVEPGGTPVGQHRTMVYRNAIENRMDIPGMTMPLENGDQIILSRNVTLLFEIINND